MVALAKLDELVGETHINAMRLHLDSMILCKNGSYSSAHQLAIQASQELSKSIVLDSLLSQTKASNGTMQDAAIADTFTSQRMLNRQVQKTIRHLSKQPEYIELATMLAKIATADDELRDKLAYVGLTKKDRKVDLSGKKVIPRLLVRKERVRQHITMNNDFFVVYISGFLAGVYSVSSDALAWELSDENLDILQMEWLQSGRRAQQLLARHQKQTMKDEEAAYDVYEHSPSSVNRPVALKGQPHVAHS